MTRLEKHLSVAEWHAILNELIAEVGAWRVLKATARHLFRKRPAAKRDLVALNNHLRRDIGMEPYHPPPSDRKWLH